jgi:flagellar motor switch protein FliM
MDPILTQSEMDALLQPAEAAAETKEVRPVDLIAREHQAFAVLQDLQDTADRLAVAVERICTRRLRLRCRAKADPVEVVPVSRLDSLIPDPRFTYGMLVDNTEAGIFAVDGLLGTAFLVCTFGGALDQDQATPAAVQPPTATERRIIRRFADECGSALDQTLSEMCRGEISIGPNPAKTGRGGSSVLFLLRVSIPDKGEGVVALALSTAAPGFKMPQIGAIRGVADPKASPLLQEVLRVAVPVFSILGSVEMKMRDFLNLKIGSVIVLDTSAESNIPLMIEGRSKFVGRPMLSNGTLSLELKSVVKE